MVYLVAVNSYSYGLSYGCKLLQLMGYLVDVNSYSYGLSYGCKHLQSMVYLVAVNTYSCKYLIDQNYKVKKKVKEISLF